MNKSRTIVALVAAGAAILAAWSSTDGSVERNLRARLAPRVREAKVPGRRESLRERFREEKEETSRGPAGKDEARGYLDGYDAWFFRQRAYPASSIPTNALGKAFAHARSHNDDDDDPFDGSFWKPLGPSSIPDGQTDDTKSLVLSPVSGRVAAIAVHPWNPDIVYVGGAQGGVWVSYDARSSRPHWLPLTDHEASLAVGSIAVDPKDPRIIYVGTGEPNFSCDSYYGRGILRSTNGGLSWKLLGGGGDVFDNAGPFVGKAVSRIVVDPATAGSKSRTTLWASTTLGTYMSGTAADCGTPSFAPTGVFRSMDSGATWQQVFSGFVSDMALDPTDHEVLYAGDDYGGGIVKSTNAATAASPTFAQLTTGLPAGTATSPLGRVSLSIAGPAAHRTLYAAIANARTSGLWGLFTTRDAGATWANVDDGFRGGATVQNVPTAFGTQARITRVSGPPYVTDGSWSLRRIHVGPESFTIFFVEDENKLLLTRTFPGIGVAAVSMAYSVANYPNYCDGQCWYDMTLAVDPTDPSGGRVYVGGNPHSFSPNAAANLAEPICDASVEACPGHYNWRTDNGGHTWSSISQGDGVKGGLHTDDHAIAIDPWGAVYDGNDGGIWRSRDRGTSWTSMNTNLAITQFQGVSTHPLTKRVVLGGTQDNGTNLRNSALVAPPKWFHSDFGDGGQSLIDQSRPSTMYHTYFNSQFSFMGPAKSSNGGQDGPGSWPFVGSYFYFRYYNGMDPTDPVSFYAPLAQHPAFTPNVVYFGSDKVYRAADPRPPCCDGAAALECTNGGTVFPPVCTNDDSWVKVSPSLTASPGSPGSYVSWIGVFPKLIAGKEVLYTGSADGRIAASKDVDGTGAATWNFIDAPPLPGRAVASIEVPGTDRTGNTAYACFSGFNDTTPGAPGHVFKTTNGLSATPTWEDISGDLPDLPCNRIIVDPSTRPASLLMGTDIGVFRTRDGGQHWKLLSKGLPHAAVFGLERNSKTGQIVASTHGRGMFQLVQHSDDWDDDAREAKAWFDRKRPYERQH